MTLWRTYYHLVWATHDRHPLLLPAHEPILYEYLRQKIKRLDAHCYAIGRIPDRIHLIVSIPPLVVQKSPKEAARIGYQKHSV